MKHVCPIKIIWREMFSKQENDNFCHFEWKYGWFIITIKLLENSGELIEEVAKTWNKMTTTFISC